MCLVLFNTAPNDLLLAADNIKSNDDNENDDEDERNKNKNGDKTNYNSDKKVMIIIHTFLYK